MDKTTHHCLSCSSLDMILHHIHELSRVGFFTFHRLIAVIGVGLVLLFLAYRSRSAVYLLDFACYRAPDSYRAPLHSLVENCSYDFDSKSLAFTIKILEKSGIGPETYGAPCMAQVPIRRSIAFCMDEASEVIFSTVVKLLKKCNINPKSIDILITNCTIFCPMPSLSAMIVNKFRMRSNIKSFHLSGMGCSAGITSVGLAKDLLRVHRNCLALIVSTECLNVNWYSGKNTSMLLPNCLFRMGGAAVLLSSRGQDHSQAKYKLQHLVRTNRASDDQSYTCIFQDVDSENKDGVSISKNILHVAGDALKANFISLGPMVLPLSEKFRYGFSIVYRKIVPKGTIHTPDFRKAFQHFCIHSGGKGIIQAVEKNLKLREEDVEASKMTLYRFGNTSSSSIWYELSYIEAKGRMKRGDKVWQLALGSGFKCNSAVWKCLHNIGLDSLNAWNDRIHLYPVEIPDNVEILQS
ncbi:hypothetical protein SLE2022_253110 [Rubroshorea leprosula]